MLGPQAKPLVKSKEAPLDEAGWLGVCRKILSLNNGIRYAGIVDSIGKEIASVYRSDITRPLLTHGESKTAIIRSTVIIDNTGKHNEKLGDPVYSFTRFEKVEWATIPLKGYFGKNKKIRDDPKNRGMLLMLSFDACALDHDALVTQQIIPYLDNLPTTS